MYSLVVKQSYTLHSDPLHISSTPLAPYVVITVFLTMFPVLYFTSPWIRCDYQSVLFNPFASFTQSSKPPLLWHPPVSSLCLWVCFNFIFSLDSTYAEDKKAVVHIHITECYLAIKKNEYLWTAWMDLKGIMLSEIVRERQISYDFTYMLPASWLPHARYLCWAQERQWWIKHVGFHGLWVKVKNAGSHICRQECWRSAGFACSFLPSSGFPA